MENKSHETGHVVGVEPAAVKSQGKLFEMAGRREPLQSSGRLAWADPAASERLVRWLIGLVNTQEEYERLERDLEELQALCPLCSNFLKGGAAQSAGIIR